MLLMMSIFSSISISIPICISICISVSIVPCPLSIFHFRISSLVLVFHFMFSIVYCLLFNAIYVSVSALFTCPRVHEHVVAFLLPSHSQIIANLTVLRDKRASEEPGKSREMEKRMKSKSAMFCRPSALARPCSISLAQVITEIGLSKINYSSE